MSVEIVVSEGRANTPIPITHPRVRCDICKGAIAIVPIELVWTEISEIEVGITIVVIIRGDAAHTVFLIVLKSRCYCTINKRAITAVSIENVHFVGLFLMWNIVVEGAAIDKVDVEMSIVVVVKEESTGSHRFG